MITYLLYADVNYKLKLQQLRYANGVHLSAVLENTALVIFLTRLSKTFNGANECTVDQGRYPYNILELTNMTDDH